MKLFAISNQLVEHALDQVENEHAIDLRRGHRSQLELDDSYYPQIESAIRVEASRMAPHYEVFYSLEKSARAVVRESLVEAHGEDWWAKECVPLQLRTDAEKRRQDEIDSGMTPRSDDPLDFTTFGELSMLITKNWDVFGSLFSSVRAVQRVMANLNGLRAPIAHCSPLAEDEVMRLKLAVRDWFRLQS